MSLGNAATAEFLRTQANELWLPILALEEQRELTQECGLTKIRLDNAIADLYKMQSSLERKAEDFENA